MEALIAFIILAVVVTTLIEVNERIKAKKKAKEKPQETKENCPQEKAGSEDCAECELSSVCKPTDAQ